MAMHLYEFLPAVFFGLCVAGGAFWLNSRILRRDVESRIIMFDSPHERRRADPSEFSGLNTRRYDEIQAELEAEGFRYLADVEDMTLARSRMNPHAPGRYMLSADGSTVAAILQLRFSPLIRILARLIAGSNPFIVMLQTRFTDDSVLLLQRCTPNIADSEPPELTAVTMAQHYSIADMVEAFRTLREQRPVQTPVVMRGLDEALALDKHADRLRREYRLKVGIYTFEDLIKQKATPEAARAQLKKIDRLLVGDPVWDPSLRSARREGEDG